MISPNSSRDAWFVSFACLVCLYLLVSWFPQPMSAQHDRGFTYLAHTHFAQGIPWGTVGMHTSGVWGLVRFPEYMRDSYPALIAGQVASALTVGTVTGVVASRFVPWAALGVLLVVGTSWACFLSDDARWFIILLSTLMFVPDFSRRRTTPAFCLLTLMLAFTFHVKGTFLVPILVMMAVVTTLELRARRAPLTLAIFLIAVFALNQLANSTPAMMWRHIRFVIGSLAGNPEVFSHVGPAYQLFGILAILGCFMSLVWLLERSKDRTAGWLMFLAYGSVAWMVYKTGFVRQDTIHASRSYYTLLPFMALYLFANDALLAERVRASRFWNSAVGRAAMASGVLALLMPPVFFQRDFNEVHHDQWNRVLRQGQGLGNLWREGRAFYDRRHEIVAASIREKHAFPEDYGGPVAVYGQLQTPVLAHGLENTPMPIIPAYEVWAPEEVERTNAFLRGDRAPRHLVLTSTGHSASNAITIAEHYELHTWKERQVFLERRPEAWKSHLDLILRAHTTWGTSIEVPKRFQGGLLMARFEYRPTLVNRLVSFLYQPPRAFVVLENGDATLARIRLNRLLMHDGLILATQNHDVWDSRNMRVQGLRHGLLSVIRPYPLRGEGAVERGAAVHRPNPKRITHIRFEGGSPPGEEWPFPSMLWPLYFQPEIDVEVFRVRFSRAPDGAGP